MGLLDELRTDDDLSGERSDPELEVPLDPNFAVISIYFVAAIIIGAFLCMIVSAVMLHFGLPRGALLVIPPVYLAVLALLAFAFAHPFTGRSTPRVPAPDTSALFHIFQIGAIGTVFGVAFLMGGGHSPRLAWVTFIFDVIVGLFYLSYLGFSLGLRYPPPKSVYAGTVWISLCAAYSWHAIHR